MSLIIAILMLLGLSATSEQLNDPAFKSENHSVIEKANTIITNQWYKTDDGVVIIDEDIT